MHNQVKFTKWVGILGMLILLACASCFILYQRYSYPYGKRPGGISLPGLYGSMLAYAGDHNGWFPRSEDGPYAALQQLYGSYCQTGRELAGVSGSIKLVTEALRNGKKLDKSLSSWIYIQGYKVGDPGNAALIWEFMPGVYYDGRRNNFGGHAVLLVNGQITNIPAADWEAFLKKQEQLRITIQKRSHEQSLNKSIDAINLICAEGLPCTDAVDIPKAQSTLDSWAKRVKSETEKYLYKFQQKPAIFNNSEAYFRILTIVTVLQQDFGVRYNPSHTASSLSPESNDSFFSDSADLFLHGILGPRRQGTCASMPVLYVAVGRKLGYPLKLVTTKGHLFARWEDEKERFNIEATNEGLNCFPEEYYRHWPFELSQAEIQSGRYLRSLTPQEELALFLQTRGMCLKAAGRFVEARAAWEKARQLAPDWVEHEMLIASVSQR